MHELFIALSLLEAAEEEAVRRGSPRVLGVHIQLGPLSGVVKEALISAFEMAREESALPEARLIVEETPLRVYCPACRAERAAVSVQLLCCAECGEPTPQLVTGRELDLVALEIA